MPMTGTVASSGRAEDSSNANFVSWFSFGDGRLVSMVLMSRFKAEQGIYLDNLHYYISFPWFMLDESVMSNEMMTTRK